ncbi:centromere protein O isoform X2 [Varanus komodoensis]|uniref:centromere protein O isoform X2 n=1 Tax=Varanus komodoensis TaxID=61221 RepID=UPI001CF7DF40|nr:centromere protein O isoform X2 [Varanus komodoensis]
MGEFTVSVRHGVLSHLEKLEASAHTAALEQGERRQHAEKVARMEARIQELKRQRDQLRAKLNACRSRFNRHKDSAESNSQAAAPTELSQQALLEWKMGNVKGLLQLFRLTGFSGRLTQHRACLCITTAFQGTYLDSYHLDLLMQEPVQIQHHSVPAFIPLEQIAAKYLQTDLKRFLSELSDHLNAYAGRKFQAEQLKEHFAAFLKGPLRGNSLHNLLEFSYGVSEAAPFPFTVKLIYGDPVSTLPTEATVTCEEDAPGSSAEMAALHQAWLLEKPLHQALSSVTVSAGSPSPLVPLESPAPSTAVPPVEEGLLPRRPQCRFSPKAQKAALSTMDFSHSESDE